MPNIVIMESPAKAKTVKGYLGSGYKVIASKGHLRDLPKSKLGVDLDRNFSADYINIRGKSGVINELKKEAKNADKIYLATDPDREGEAIAWHLSKILNIDEKKAVRITFNEITKTVVRESIKHPRPIDMNLVNSQQTRRILDRIVGYKISPLLWKKLRSGLSAGRVQSVATRLIVDREAEIRAFVPSEYWTITALLETAEKDKLTAKFHGNKNQKIELKNKEETDEILNHIRNKDFIIDSVKKNIRSRTPAPPFITSTLQQEANKKLNFQSQRTMMVAQTLYEGVNLGAENGGTHGLITYMRTDSLRIADEAKSAAKAYILSNYGEKFYPEKERVYKTKKNAQDAHEAIRPSEMKFTPAEIEDKLTPDQYKIYKLIWDRFIASQMESAVYDVVTAEIQADMYIFRASGQKIKFPGFLSVYEEDVEEETNLPELHEGDKLTPLKITPAQHFTEPPPRYTEASLIKAMEEQGIGRPSTYTPTITTIIQRNYVERNGKSLRPTPLGEVTTQIMKDNFTDIVDYGFTAKIEDDFDEIEDGKRIYTDVLKEFYDGFKVTLEKAEANIGKEEIALPAEELDAECPNCGKNLVVKHGRFGKFAACPGYPECKTTMKLDREGNIIEKSEKTEDVKTDMKCVLCGGDVVIKAGRYGAFYACSNYPKCKYTKPKDAATGIPCPLCGEELVKKAGKGKTMFYSCSAYPKCKFSTNDEPQPEKCPLCSSLLLKKKLKDVIICYNETCEFNKK